MGCGQYKMLTFSTSFDILQTINMTQHSELHTTLTRLGLKDTEVMVYLATLEQGETTILTLAKTTGIKRGTVYEITNRLIERGFLKVTMSEKRRFLVAEDPRIVTAKFKEYSDTLFSQLPQLLALQNSNENKPKITYYEGEDGIWQILDDTLRQPNEILSYDSVTDIYHSVNPQKVEDYIKRRVAKKIPTRIISLESDVSKLWTKRGPAELRDIRTIPKGTYNFAADMEIYGNKVAIMSYKNHLFGIVIESEQISQLYRSAFELMWQGAATQKKK